MFNFFNRKRSKETLKDRLKLVLDYDRSGLAPGQMEALKSELLKVIKKYFPSVDSEYDVRLEQHGSRMVFEANLPKNKE
jgi:cell division topological specificity factor